MGTDIDSIPATLLATTKPPPGAPEAGRPIWLLVRSDFAKKLTHGRLVVIEGSGHYIQQERPKIVVNAVRDIIVQ